MRTRPMPAIKPGAPVTRARRQRSRVYDETGVTKEQQRTVAGGDSGMYEATGVNRGVWRTKHRVGSLTYVSQIRHSAVGVNGYLALIPGSNSTPVGIIVRSDGEMQALGGPNANGYCSHRFTAGGANEHGGVGVGYGPYTTLAYTPSSVTFFTVGFGDVNVSTTQANGMTDRGFMFDVKSTAGGDVSCVRHYVTNP